MKRKIIRIDEEKCNGCGLCMPGCPEGALQMIDGKARLVSELFCDGLGACIGQCPEGAIRIEEREAAPYDERQVIAGIARQGKAVVEAHLKHLRDHNETVYLEQALSYLREQGLLPAQEPARQVIHSHASGGCPGSRPVSFAPPAAETAPGPVMSRPSRLTHWPIQLHLISPMAPHFQGADLLLAADCVAYSMGGFHEDYLKGKTLAIACPKLDSHQEAYVEKLTGLIDGAGVRSITVMIMQVPCCGGLLQIARRACAQAERRIPVEHVVVGLRGEILQKSGSLQAPA
jgi:ferredoxin